MPIMEFLKRITVDVVHPFLLSLAIGILIAYPVLQLLIKLKSRQTIYNLAPSTHQAKQGTPTMGGLIILIAFLVCALIVAPWSWPILIWLAGFAFIGFADDYIIPRKMKSKRGLGWIPKLIAQTVLAAIAGIALYAPSSSGSKFAAMLLFVFLVLFFCNAYNFADGLDGMAGTIGLLMCFGLIAVKVITGDIYNIVLFGALAGAFIPFLALNAPPAKVFMGDVGSLPIGAFFGAATCLLIARVVPTQTAIVWQPEMLPAVFALSFMMIAELVPVPMQVAYFKLTKKRIFPMTPIHHAFEVKGWPESRVVWSFILFELVMVVLAVGLAAGFSR